MNKYLCIALNTIFALTLLFCNDSDSSNPDTATPVVLQSVKKGYRLKARIIKGADSVFISETQNLYNEEGLLEQQVYLDENGSPVSSYLLHYNDNGKVIEQINSGAENEILCSYTVSYNDDGTRHMTIEKGKEGEEIWTEEYEYDENKRRIKIMHIEITSDLSWSSEYKYNEEGQTIEYIKKDSQGAILYAYEHIYLEGNLIKRIRKDALGDIETTHVFEYDPMGNMTLQEYRDSQGNRIWTSEHKYDSNGKCIETIHYDENYEIQWSKETGYNEEGRIVKNVNKNGDGIITSQVLNKYEDTRLIESEILDKDDKIIQTTYYIYEEGINFVLPIMFFETTFIIPIVVTPPVLPDPIFIIETPITNINNTLPEHEPFSVSPINTISITTGNTISYLH